MGRHVQNYSKEIAGRLGDIYSEGQAQNWSQAQYATQLRSTLSEIRQELRAGNIALNCHARSWAPPCKYSNSKN